MTHAKTNDCPVCGEELEKPMRVEVCGDCYGDLRAAGNIPLQATGEFSAVSLQRAEIVTPPTRPRSLTADQSITCTWCGKRRDEVKKILSNEGAHICNECVALCSTILEDEVGPDWRG
jgi:NMD protein affecting ribosome stability and mRNA decay